MTLLTHFSLRKSDVLIAQKDTIRSNYEQLLDIPAEYELFTQKLGTQEAATFYNKLENLQWVCIRIKTRIEEAKNAFQDALQRMHNGVLDLSNKNLCDLTVKDIYIFSGEVQHMILNGNYLKKLPPVCYLKPYLARIEAIGNCADLEKKFEDFLAENRTNFDLFQVFYAICQEEFPYKVAYLNLYHQIAQNTDQQSLKTLALRVNACMQQCQPNIEVLSIHPQSQGMKKWGGIRGFIQLHYFSNLQQLDLSGCQLEPVIPFNWLSELSNIKRVDLSDTPITQWPCGLQNAPLEELNMSKTSITQMPPWLSTLQKLRILNITDTRVDKLPTCIETIPLQRCILDGTLITTLPRFHQNMKELSIKRTPICQIPTHLLSLLQKTQIRVDETNNPLLQLQVKVCTRFYSPVVANWIFYGEKYKRQQDSVPSVIKTGIVGLQYMAVIAFLMVWQVTETLILSVPAPCQMKAHVKSDKFSRFKQHYAAPRASLIYVLCLFQFLPLIRRWQDIKAVSKFVVHDLKLT